MRMRPLAVGAHGSSRPFFRLAFLTERRSSGSAADPAPFRHLAALDLCSRPEESGRPGWITPNYPACNNCDHTLWLELTLIAPTGPYAFPVDIPWIAIQVRTKEGSLDAHYVGTGQLVNGGPTGRVDFSAIPNTRPGEGWPASLSGRITWSCAQTPPK